MAEIPGFYKSCESLSVETDLIYRDETNDRQVSEHFFQRPDSPCKLALPSSNYAQISISHGRAVVDMRGKGRVKIGALGEVISATDQKGGVLYLESDGCHVIQRDLSCQYNYSIKGLKDGTALPERIIYVSEMWRSYGLSTEIPVRISRIKQLIHKKKLVGESKWRKATAKRINYSGRYDREEQQEFVENSQFFIVERQLPIAERVRDLARLDDYDSLVKLLKPVFNIINTVSKIKGEGIISGTPKPDRFDINSRNDIKRYLQEWLPEQMGMFLGVIHRNGWFHKYPHGQNWTLLGTLVDLDSPRHKSLGDKVDTKDFIIDINQSYDGFGALRSMLGFLCPDTEYLTESYYEEVRTWRILIAAHFFKGYLSQNPKFSKTKVGSEYMRRNADEFELAKKI